jgi:serine protease Do
MGSCPPLSTRPAPAQRRHRGAVALAVSLILLVAPATSSYARGPDSLADEAAAVSDAVVNISATQTMDEKKGDNAGSGSAPELQQGTPFDDLFEEFFKKRRERNGEDAPRQAERKSNSLGSGFVIDPTGIIITNNHVIADANEITVIFTDGQKLRAKVIGKDSKVDVAVLKVEPAKPLKSVKFGDSEAMRVGDWVMAVGNPFGLGGTVTAGIVSARHRNIDSGPYDNYIQTDAAINKGNSGGPLFNMAGDVIGINTAILSPSGGSIGIGFATPASTVQPVIDQLQKYGEARRGWLGVRIRSIDETVADSLDLKQTKGAFVSGADEKGPAAAGGIQTGDVIVKFDGHAIDDSRDLPKLVAQAPVGKDVTVVLIRQGKEITKTVRLGRLDDGDAKPAPAPVKKSEVETPPSESAVQAALGMSFSGLTSESRRKYTINDSVASGVVISDVAANSPAADKRLQAGEVLVEINQEPVKQPSDAARKIEALKTGGKKSALLLVANAQGEVRFVSVPVN